MEIRIEKGGEMGQAVQASKVAVMTWYTGSNYGTILQAAALQEVLRQMGYAPFLIPFTGRDGSAMIPQTPSEFVSGYVRQKLKNLTYAKDAQRDEKNKLFISERARFTEQTATIPELDDLSEEYDALICGSDQIWSPLCYTVQSFLPKISHKEKKIAYAASFGATAVKDPRIREEMGRNMEDFAHLSAREASGAAIIEDLTGRKAERVVDPTLLLTVEQWNEYADVEDPSVERLSGEYILCYFLENQKRYLPYVKQLSKQLGIPYYIIPYLTSHAKDNHRVPFAVGPTEFLSLIRNAAHVCTDSFHGMVFSANYEVPFSVFPRFFSKDPQNQNSRIYHFLKVIRAEERLVEPLATSVSENMLHLNYTQIRECLKIEREHSLMWLSAALACTTGTQERKKQQPLYRISAVCSGCGACAAVCPTGAVSVNLNEDGFWHCKIDQDVCIQCGKCKTVCPMTRIQATKTLDAEALYALKSMNSQILQTSTSGGAGHLLASHYSQQGYWVCGCIYDSLKNRARHILISPEEPEKLPLLQGSKYIQSDTTSVMRQLANMPTDRKLIFFGTPCQVAAADKLLRKRNMRDHAILVDLICHGVPSDLIWQKYLREIDTKFGVGAHPQVYFRCPDIAWRKKKIQINGMSATYSQWESKDAFYNFFLNSACNMESCYECSYRDRIPGDLRIGDFWGPRFIDDHEGVSMVIAATTIGMEAMQTIGVEAFVEEFPIKEFYDAQYALNLPEPLLRRELLQELKKDGTTLMQIWNRHCRYYDVMRILGPWKQRVKGLLNK